MSGYIDPYAARRDLNEASRFWATRNAQPWTDADEMVLLSEWILVEPSQRREVEVSQRLERTIEACRVRCELIRERLGIQVHVVTRTVITTAVAVCPACWLEHPEGACDR